MTEQNVLRENLAVLCHWQWAHWMDHIFTVCKKNKDGTVTIPQELVQRWDTQRVTTFTYLSESEQESDRKQADKFLKVIKKELDTSPEELKALRECRDAALEVNRCMIQQTIDEHAESVAKTILYAQECMKLQEELGK